MIGTNPNEDEILRQPGYLYWNPTNLASEATWGDLLGFTEEGIEVIPNVESASFEGEEYGNDPVIMLYLGCACKVKVRLKNWNDTSIARLFPGMSSSGNVFYPNTIYPGARLDTTTYAKRLLFAPFDEGVHNKIFLAPMAVGVLAGILNFSANKDTVYEILFHCFRKGSGSEIYRGFYIGSMSGATLL